MVEHGDLEVEQSQGKYFGFILDLFKYSRLKRKSFNPSSLS